MDPEIQNGLEDYLHGLNGRARAKPQAQSFVGKASDNFAQRLNQTDAETRRQIAEFTQTASMLHALQPPTDENAMDSLQPSPGFYARVMERIEAKRASSSFWSVFLNPQFSSRLLLASGALLILLGVSLAVSDSDTGLFGTAIPELVEAQPFGMPEDLAVESASQPIEAGFVSHNESGHDQMLVQLATYPQ